MARYILDKNLKPSQQAAVELFAILKTHEENEARKLRQIELDSEEARKQKEFEKMMARDREEKRKAAEKKAVDDRYAASKQLEIDLREKYFAANPGALEADFRRDLPTLKQQQFLEKMKSRDDTEASFRATMPRM